MKEPKTGELNQKISIYRMDNIADGSGGSEQRLILYWETNSRAVQLKSNPFLQALQGTFQDGYTFDVRYRSDKNVQKDMIIKYRGGDLIIQSCINDDVYKKWTTITAVWSRRPDL